MQTVTDDITVLYLLDRCAKLSKCHILASVDGGGSPSGVENSPASNSYHKIYTLPLESM